MMSVLRLAALLVTLVAFGCQSGSAPPDLGVSRGGSRGDRFRLTMYVRDVDLAEEYYEVDGKGVLGFGGGLDARFTRTSWTTPLSESERAELNDLIDRHGWIDRELNSTNQPVELLYRVDVRTDVGGRRFNLKGDHPAVSPVREWLRQKSLRRLEPELRKLPEPGKQPG